MIVLAILLGIATALATGWWWFSGHFKNLDDFLSHCGLTNRDDAFYQRARILQTPQRSVAIFAFGVVIPATCAGAFVALCTWKLPELVLFALSVFFGIATLKHTASLGKAMPVLFRWAMRINVMLLRVPGLVGPEHALAVGTGFRPETRQCRQWLHA